MQEILIRRCVFILMLMGPFMACNQPAPPATSTQAIPAVDSVPTKEEKSVNPSTACAFDALRFREKLGIGTVSISHKVGALALYKTPDLQDTVGTIHFNRYPNQFQWEGKQQVLHWFLHRTEYRAPHLIALQHTNGAVQVKLDFDGKTQNAWISDTSKANGRNLISLLSWNQMMQFHTIWLTDTALINNPLRTAPTDTADLVKVNIPFRAIQVHAIEHQWINISIQTVNGGMRGSDKFSPPLGWIRWYCNDTLQISFPDFYTLEAYALRLNKQQ